MTLNLPMIGANHGNVVGMKAIAQLSPPLFRRHTGHSVKAIWHGYIGRQLTAARVYKSYGKPHVDWIFGVLSREERLLLQALFPAYVTVRVFNEDTDSWINANGTLLHPDLGATERRQRKWLNVQYEIIDLVEI